MMKFLLHLATKKGYTNFAKVLIAAGANVNATMPLIRN